MAESENIFCRTVSFLEKRKQKCIIRFPLIFLKKEELLPPVSGKRSGVSVRLFLTTRRRHLRREKMGEEKRRKKCLVFPHPP